MPAAKTERPTSTNNPTRSSVQVNCLRCGIFSSLPFILPTPSCPSHEKAFQIFVLCSHKFFLPALEINPTCSQNQKTRRGHLCRARSVSFGDAVNDALGRGVETKVRQREAVLKALRRKQR